MRCGPRAREVTAADPGNATARRNPASSLTMPSHGLSAPSRPMATAGALDTDRDPAPWVYLARLPLAAHLVGRQHHDPPVRLDPHALGPHPRVLDERHVHDPALDGGHRLELDDLARLQHTLGRSPRDVAQLVLAPAAVVLDVDRDAIGLTLAARDDQVHQVLQACQLLPPPPDEHPQVIALDVELRRLGAHRDLDGPGELHQAQELFQHRLCLVHHGALLVGELLHRLGRHERNGVSNRTITPISTFATVRPGRANSPRRASPPPRALPGNPPPGPERPPGPP